MEAQVPPAIVKSIGKETDGRLSDPAGYRVADDRFYTKEHEWTKVTSGTARVGITDYAAKTLNDIVYLTLPSVGKTLAQASSFGTVESIKAVSELYAPLSGAVSSVNAELTSRPELINQSPYDEGWIIEITHSKLEQERSSLLSPKQYGDLLKALHTGSGSHSTQ